MCLVLLLSSCGYAAIAGCGEDEVVSGDVDAGTEAAAADTAAEARSPEVTGSACTTAAQCYGHLDAQSLKGEPRCLDRVTNGYCTHVCQTDADCCAVPGECRTGLKQVCAPFESAGEKYCFLSCEAADINAANDAGATDAGTDEQSYCKKNVSDEFSCRSTGGGAENRKACIPTGPAGDGGPPKDAAGDAPSDALLDVSLDAADSG